MYAIRSYYDIGIRNTFMRVLNEEKFIKNYIVDDLLLSKTKRKLG